MHLNFTTLSPGPTVLARLGEAGYKVGVFGKYLVRTSFLVSHSVGPSLPSLPPPLAPSLPLAFSEIYRPGVR